MRRLLSSTSPDSPMCRAGCASAQHRCTWAERGEVKTATRPLLLALAAILLTAAPALAAPPSDTLAEAEAAFAEGVALRGDSEKARPAFARAAARYDILWSHGHRTPELALNRSRAHRLAGSLPRAVAALHEGLAVARFSRPLQTELADARAAVQFPLDGELAAQCQPPPVRGISARVSPADAWVVGGGLWLLACTGVARFVMTRGAVWLAFAALWVCALLALGGLWGQDLRDRAREEALPLLIVADDATLRRGNAGSYPARFDAVLPKGAEVRELGRRGGWVQVRLAGGAIGWLPQTAVLPCAG